VGVCDEEVHPAFSSVSASREQAGTSDASMGALGIVPVDGRRALKRGDIARVDSGIPSQAGTEGAAAMIPGASGLAGGVHVKGARSSGEFVQAGLASRLRASPEARTILGHE
jgi:hypothetical protein